MAQNPPPVSVNKISTANEDARTDMSKIATTLVSWYAWLSSPALSERERVRRQITASRNYYRRHADLN